VQFSDKVFNLFETLDNFCKFLITILNSGLNMNYKQKSKVILLVITLIVLSSLSFGDGKPKITSVCIKDHTLLLNKAADGGGVSPFLQSCIFGPRIGLEANEGKPATFMEIMNAFILPGFPIIMPVKAFFKNGVKGMLAACLIGPRVGMQIDKRKLRDLEWLLLIPVFNLYPRFTISWEAYKGRTMSEIENEENLKK